MLEGEGNPILGLPKHYKKLNEKPPFYVQGGRQKMIKVDDELAKA